jgi:hypothetical protein
MQRDKTDMSGNQPSKKNTIISIAAIPHFLGLWEQALQSAGFGVFSTQFRRKRT